MLAGLDPVVVAQMALGAVADVAFAIALGATLLGFGAASRVLTMRGSLLIWLVAQLGYLVLQASSMSGEPVSAAGPAVGAVLTQSHFGRMWILGIGAGGLATLKTLEAGDSKTVAYSVKGFTCITCAVGLETLLRQEKGVLSAKASYPDASVVIRYQPGAITEDQLKKFIADMGFKAEPKLQGASQ